MMRMNCGNAFKMPRTNTNPASKNATARPPLYFTLICEGELTMICPSYCCGLENCAALADGMKAVASANRSTACCNARMAARSRSHRSVPLIERNRTLELRSTPARHPDPASSRSARRRRAPRCSTQRAGITPLRAFISVPASFVGGVPLTRAMNPWAMPEASR
jgi:hypothetical protein